MKRLGSLLLIIISNETYTFYGLKVFYCSLYMFRANWTHHQEYTVNIIQNLCNHMITYFAPCVGVFSSLLHYHCYTHIKLSSLLRSQQRTHLSLRSVKHVQPIPTHSVSLVPIWILLSYIYIPKFSKSLSHSDSTTTSLILKKNTRKRRHQHSHTGYFIPGKEHS
jgi:hypothetical protein